MAAMVKIPTARNNKIANQGSLLSWLSFSFVLDPSLAPPALPLPPVLPSVLPSVLLEPTLGGAEKLTDAVDSTVFLVVMVLLMI